jgi:hypothetical protein
MMNPNVGYNQANMRGHMTLMPGSSPTYHPKAAPGPDPYGYGPGVNQFAPMGQQQVITPTGSQPYFAASQDPSSMYPPQQQRFSGERGRNMHTAAPPAHQPYTQQREVPTRKAECQEECAEEECVDSEQCGNEQRPPKPEQLCCGIDTRPFLPLALTLSTLCGLICFLLIQVPMESRMYGVEEFTLYAITVPIYAITLYCLAFSALMDPGQLPKDYQPPPGAPLINSSSNNNDSTDAEEEEAVDRALPRRAHKCWQYKRPIRRYDHYCRWLTNVIGLMNHREFIIMVVGLVLIGLLGIVRDCVLLVAMYREGNLWGSSVFVVLHLAYSIGMTGLAGPILKIHIGLVSRNEVAHEWKKNSHYIVRQCKHGENFAVNALSDDEFNSLFDSFVYDNTKNPLDKGCPGNCWNFWCTPRWSSDQLGEF